MALIAWYKLDGDAKNNTGDSSLDGVSTDVSWVDGKIGKCGSFNGNGSRITVENIDVLKLIDTDLTISVWIYPLSNPGSNSRIIEKKESTSGTSNGWMFWMSGNYLAFSTGEFDERSITEISHNTWTHLAISMKSGLWTAYKNGQKVWEKQLPSIISSTEKPLAIGNNITGIRSFHGSIDDIRIYNRALSEKEIRRLALVDSKALIGHWPLAGDAKDISGFNNHGVVNGAVSSSGIFGQSMLFDGINDTISFGVGSDWFPLKSFSFSIWFKSLGQTPTTGTTPSILGFTYGVTVQIKGSSILYGLDNGTSFSYIESARKYDFYNDNKWHHLLISATPTKRQLYIDGLLEGELEDSWTGVTRWLTNTCNIGRDNNNSNYYFKGFLSDFRIYNYALTEEEVSKLAQPLVLHYKFDDRIEEATENLVPAAKRQGSGGIWYNGATGTVTENIWVPKLGMYMTHIEGSGGAGVLKYLHSFGNMGEAGNGKSYTISFDVYNIGTTNMTFTGNILNRRLSGKSPLPPGEFTRLVYTGITNNYGQVQIQFRSDVASNGINCYVANLQLEQKDHSTPFVDGIREGNIIKDSSLSQNHGSVELATTPVWSSGEVSYGAMEFFGEDPYLFIDSDLNSIQEYPFTISAWVKAKVTSNWQMAVSLVGGPTTYWCIGTQNNKWSISIRSPQININSNVNVDQDWHLLTGVFSSSSTKLFLDGKELFDSMQVADITTPPNGITIGRQRRVDTTYGHGPVAWNGFIDDVRVYAKALTNSEIQEIYNERSRQLRFGSDKTKKITMGGTGSLEIN